MFLKLYAYNFRGFTLKEKHIKFKEKLAKDLLDDVLDIVKSLF